MTYHVGRSFSGTRLEDECPCPKAPCGLVLADSVGGGAYCPQHSLAAAKTIRQMHHADDCTGEAERATISYRIEDAA